MGKFATGVAIITTIAGDTPYGLTANSFSSVSLDPPLVLFCLGRSSTNFEVFMDADCFAVNILAASQQALSTRFALYEGDRFEGVAWQPAVTGAPEIGGAVCIIDCQLEARHDAGDHIIMVGRVAETRLLSDAPPLVYYEGKYTGLS